MKAEVSRCGFIRSRFARLLGVGRLALPLAGRGAAVVGLVILVVALLGRDHEAVSADKRLAGVVAGVVVHLVPVVAGLVAHVQEAIPARRVQALDGAPALSAVVFSQVALFDPDEQGAVAAERDSAHVGAAVLVLQIPVVARLARLEDPVHAERELAGVGAGVLVDGVAVIAPLPGLYDAIPAGVLGQDEGGAFPFLASFTGRVRIVWIDAGALNRVIHGVLRRGLHTSRRRVGAGGRRRAVRGGVVSICSVALRTFVLKATGEEGQDEEGVDDGTHFVSTFSNWGKEPVEVPRSGFGLSVLSQLRWLSRSF